MVCIKYHFTVQPSSEGAVSAAGRTLTYRCSDMLCFGKTKMQVLCSGWTSTLFLREVLVYLFYALSRSIELELGRGL